MWFYKDQLFDNVLSEFDSFVYLIERLNTLEDSKSPIYYIGKKTFFNKLKLKNKRIIVESDWWEYYGSSDWLSEHVEKYGKDNFKRHILHLCRTKGDAGYLEAKEQIIRNVLHIDKNNYKLYYNKNILGRYKNEPEFYLLEDDLKSYYALDGVNGNNYNKVWVTNGKNNRLVNKSIGKELVESSNWNYGRCEKHIDVNDGNTNFIIPKSKFDSNKYQLGHIKKYVTNGQKDKLLPTHQIDKFIKYNTDWYIGYSKNNEDIWITNGKIDKKIKKKEKDNYPSYKFGRSVSGVRNKISIVKNDKQMWIPSSELIEYINDGWKKQGKKSGYKIFMVTDEINQKHFHSENEKNIFLKNNKDWRDGQLNRKNFNTKNKVFAKDIRTDEKVIVTPEEYKNNKYLTSLKTKKVKIKRKNRIIFEGYLDLFIIENPKYPKNQFANALRSETGDLYFKKGKNIWMNNEKINIRWK